MLGPMIDLAIGMIFFYLVLSLMVSALNELIAWFISLRAKTLHRGIMQLLDDTSGGKWVLASAKSWIQQHEKAIGIKAGADADDRAKKWDNLAAEIYNHPLIKGLSQDDKLPSYIPSSAFATALLDLLKEKASSTARGIAGAATGDQYSEEEVVKKIKEAIEDLPSKKLRDTLSALMDESVTKMDQARVRIARWYDNAMTRVSGWYKRYTQGVVVFCAFLVAAGLNADTIVVARALNGDPKLRDQMGQLGADWVKQHQRDNDCSVAGAGANGATGVAAAAADGASTVNLDCVTKKWAQANAALTAANLPIGWTKARWEAFKEPQGEDFVHELMFKLLGIFLTVLAISQGAPFWFDLLNRVVNLKTNGAAPPTEPRIV